MYLCPHPFQAFFVVGEREQALRREISTLGATPLHSSPLLARDETRSFDRLDSDDR